MQASRVIRRYLLPALAVALAAVVLLLSPGAQSAEAQDGVAPSVTNDHVYGVVGTELEFDLCANDNTSGNVTRVAGRYPGGIGRGKAVLGTDCMLTGLPGDFIDPDGLGYAVTKYTYKRDGLAATVTFTIFSEDAGFNPRAYGPQSPDVPNEQAGVVKRLPDNCDADGNLNGPEHTQATFVNARTFVFAEGWHCVQDIIAQDNWTFIGEQGAKVRPAASPTNEKSTFVRGAAPGLEKKGRYPAYLDELAENVAVENLEITGYKGTRNIGAIQSSGGFGWRIINNNIHDNVGAGIDIGPQAIVSGNEIHNNAQIGISGFGFNINREIILPALTNVTIENNAVYGNGNNLVAVYPDYRYNHHEGGIKVTKARNLIVQNNWIFDNEGIGFFCDLFCDGVAVTDNVFIENFADQVLAEPAEYLDALPAIDKAIDEDPEIDADDETYADIDNDLSLTRDQKDALKEAAKDEAKSKAKETARKVARIRPRSAGAIFFEISKNIVIQDNTVRAVIPEIPEITATDLGREYPNASPPGSIQEAFIREGILKKTTRSWQDDGRSRFLGGITVAESTDAEIFKNFIKLISKGSGTLSSSISIRNHSHLRAPGFDGTPEYEMQPSVADGQPACWHESRGELGYIPRRILIEDNDVMSDASSFVGQPAPHPWYFSSAWKDYHGEDRDTGPADEPPTPACGYEWDATRQLSLMCHQVINDSVVFQANPGLQSDEEIDQPVVVSTAWYGTPEGTEDSPRWTFPQADEGLPTDDNIRNLSSAEPCWRLTCSGVTATHFVTAGSRLNGTDGDDVIIGTSGDDQIYGFDGDDIICARAGEDMIRGGNGNDEIFAGDDADQIFGEAHDDTIDGGSGDDIIKGGAGEDTIKGGDGDDTISGNNGDDNLYGNNGVDIIHGGDGNDDLEGYAQIDTFDGGRGVDYCYNLTAGESSKRCTSSFR